MAISTNSIIHYTKELKYLKGILENGFKVFYCYEKVLSSKKGYMHSVFPMISFCDIPLAQVKQHIDSYGDYGIGLTKDWAKSYGLNPVLYFDKDSELINYFRSEFERLNEKRKKKEIENEDIEHLIKILSYSKNYEADLTRKDKTIKNYRFYDEKEWRYVPNSTILGSAKPFLSEKVYSEDKDKYNKTLDHITIKFEPEDISYIIVKDESDIKEITQHIRSLFASKCTLEKMEIIMTRIITTDQIRFDI
ncbi:hypothetical protein KUL113_19900 [Tenacibaculum sp. KUL113]|nr:hypothetical protein KUL113_19900 [Tenacibaculum sp. KUL113]